MQNWIPVVYPSETKESDKGEVGSYNMASLFSPTAELMTAGKVLVRALQDVIGSSDLANVLTANELEAMKVFNVSG